MFVRVLVVAAVAAGATAPAHSQRAFRAAATEQRGGAPEQAPPVRLQLTDPSLPGGRPGTTAEDRARQILGERVRFELEAGGAISCPMVLVRPAPGVEHAVREVKPDERIDHRIRRLAPRACVE
jgi:hypothetical protein